MTEGKGNFQWTQTAHLLALIANTNRAKKNSKVFYPEDLNPYAIKKKPSAIVITGENVSVMREAFLGSYK